MKRSCCFVRFAEFYLMSAILFMSVSCDILGKVEDPGTSDGKGELRISFASDQYVTRKADPDVPDTSDFHLTVTSSTGSIVYDGVYSASPEAIMVDPGSYDVKVVSCDFKVPAFSSPQYGDDQCVVVPSGEIVNVRLMCTQINSGIRLKVDRGFLDAYPDGVLFLKSAQGKLMYGYSEKRIAYFRPGNVSLLLSSGGKDEVLLTRNLKAQEILQLDITVSPNAGQSGTGSRISVAVDTSRTWISDSYIIGGENDKGSEITDALTVSQAMDHIGDEDVWVSGYIVGGDLTSSSASFEIPFSSRTNILIGPRSSTINRSSCIAVQLPSGSVRDALNLVDNPNNLERKVCIRGDIVESYYSLIGLKSVTDYEFQ